MQKRGIGGLATEAVDRVRRRIHVDSRHLWLALDLEAREPYPGPSGDWRLVSAGRDDLPRIVELGPAGLHAAERYLTEGATPWMVLEGGDLLFSCWTFPGQMPAIIGHDGWITPPAGDAFLEESVTAPSARGRGVAPFAWSAIAEALAGRGVRRLHTPVEPENQAVRRALAKVGFLPVATTHTVRRWPRTTVAVEVLDGAGAWARDHACPAGSRPARGSSTNGASG